jgi:hypothetical protein
MHTKHQREEPLVDLGYEIRDIDYKGLGKATLFFMAFVLFSFGSVGFWFWRANPQTSSTLDPRKPMPAMTIQSNIAVRTDIQTFRQKETETLTKGGQNADGSYRIPIDKALDLVAQRGLAAEKTNVPAISPHNTIKQNALAPGETPGAIPPLTGDIGAPPSAVSGASKP